MEAKGMRTGKTGGRRLHKSGRRSVVCTIAVCGDTQLHRRGMVPGSTATPPNRNTERAHVIPCSPPPKTRPSSPPRPAHCLGRAGTPRILRGAPLSQGFSQLAYREQHFDCLACHVADQHRAGIDIYVDGDTRLDDDVAGRGWVSYATERMSGIGQPRVEVPPAGFMKDKGPGDIMWEVIETRMTPPVEGKIDKAWLELDRAYKAIAPMTDKPVKIGSISAQILALMLTDQHYNDRLQLLFDMSAALNREYHALADAGAPIVQIEEPAIVALSRAANIVRKELKLPEADIPATDPKLSMVPLSG